LVDGKSKADQGEHFIDSARVGDYYVDMSKLPALLLFAMSCGSVSTVDRDANTVDEPSSGPASVTVFVNQDTAGAVPGQLDLGAIVVFVDSAGQLIKDTLVDGNGTAAADVTPNSTLHVIRVVDEGAIRRVQITSLVGIKPGDKLQAGRSKLLTDFTGSAASMKASFPTAASSTISLTTPCQTIDAPAGAASVDLTLKSDCAAATFDVLQTINTGVNDQVNYRYKTAIAPQAGATIALDQTVQVMMPFTLTVANTPASAKRLSMEKSTLIGSQPSVPLVSLGNLTPVTGTNQLVSPHPPGVGTGSTVKLNVEYAAGTESIELLINGIGTTGGIDMDKLKVPVIAGPLDFSPTGLNVAFTVDSGRSADISYYRWQGGWKSGTRDLIVTWDSFTGVPLQAFVLPKLPAKFAEYDPSTVAPSNVTVFNGIALFVDVDALNGWDDARPLGDTMVGDLWTLPRFANQTVARRLSAQFNGR
jgi:hypothetical protein